MLYKTMNLKMGFIQNDTAKQTYKKEYVYNPFIALHRILNDHRRHNIFKIPVSGIKNPGKNNKFLYINGWSVGACTNTHKPGANKIIKYPEHRGNKTAPYKFGNKYKLNNGK